MKRLIALGILVGTMAVGALAISAHPALAQMSHTYCTYYPYTNQYMCTTYPW